MKRFTRLFTIADWIEEEEWLREQSKKGLKLTKLHPPINYVFEETEPEDVVYKLDYKNEKASSEVKQMYQDYGWEYCGTCFGWNYFRKPANQINDENEGELFSDKQSKLEMIERIIRTRMMPIIVLFLCVLVPNFRNCFRESSTLFDYIFAGFISILFIIYIYLILHCGLKLNKIRKQIAE